MSDPLSTLQNKWYNALAAAVGGNADFQIIQPNATLPPLATNDLLWHHFNNIPPKSLTSNLTLSGGNQLYSDYMSVLSQLSSNALTNFQNTLGSYYPLWQQYLAGLNPLPTPQTLPSTFYQWALVNAPTIAGPGRSAYQAALLDPIFQAQTMVGNTAGFVNNTPNFTQTLQNLFQQVPAGSSLSLSFDSDTASGDVTHTWAAGGGDSLFGIFGSSSESSDQLTQVFSSSRVTVEASFQHAITFVADPPGPPNGWYSSAALSNAHSSQGGGTPWSSNASPNWNSTFGPNGNMQQFVGSLIVVDGMSVTVTSYASYSSDQQTTITHSSSGGFWPFYWGGGSSTYTNHVSFNSASNLVYTMSSPASCPMIIGANVLPASQYLGGNAELSRFVLVRAA